MNDGWRFSREDVARECRALGNFLHLEGCVGLKGEPLDGPQLMWAFALKESFHEPKGARNPKFFVCPPRFEPIYFTGKYADSPTQADLNRMYGQDGAKSYGCWQVMLCNVPHMKPEEFRFVESGAQAFICHMNRIIDRQKPQGDDISDLTQLADAYNSGNFRDWIVPDKYVKQLTEYYYQVSLPKAEAAGA